MVPSVPSPKCANPGSLAVQAVVNAPVKVKASAVRAMVSAMTVHVLRSSVVKLVQDVMIVVRKANVKPARKATVTPAAAAAPISVARVLSSSNNVHVPSAATVRSTRANASIPPPSRTMLP